MAHGAAERREGPPPFGGLGLAAEWATAFRDAARRRAPRLAQLHAACLTSAYHAEGVEIAAIPWRARWPVRYLGSLTLPTAAACAIEGLAGVDRRLGAAATALWEAGVVTSRPGPARTEVRLFGPPRVRLDYDGSIAAAITLAHELGHAVQMADGAGRSRRGPPLAVGETAAQFAERVAEPKIEALQPWALAAQRRDDLLAMLVRHPARDALEQAGFEPQAWPLIAAGYAPSHRWGEGATPVTDAQRATPGSVLAYGLAAAVSVVLAARWRRAPEIGRLIGAWFLSGPTAQLDALEPLLPARLSDPLLYEHAYDLAEQMMSEPLP